jgi:hypothetical protein
MEKICNDKQILNPITNRCVNKNGIIGKKLLIDNEKIHLFWENNSCYIDSILIALFHNKNIDILNYPLIIYKNDKLNLLTKKINNELINLFEIIYKRKKHNTCSILRKTINNFYNKLIKFNPNKQIIDKNENWTNSQLDIFDFLNLFQNIYNIPDDLKFKEGNNINYSNFIFNIPTDLIINKKKLYINKILPSFNIKNNKKIFKTTLLKSDKLFLNIYRNIETFKLDTKIIPAKILKLPDNSFNLYLTSIIIHYGNHHSGHYICLYKSNNKWFEYNDLNNSPIYIGNLNKIIQNNNYISNIVGLLYIK